MLSTFPFSPAAPIGAATSTRTAANIIDELTGEAFAIDVAGSLRSGRVLSPANDQFS